MLEDELSWMNVIRRVRFYLPSGQFYDTDFDPEMGMKEIKKIIGLIASIKKPFSLFYENTKLPDTDNETLNSIFKNKPFEEIIIMNIQINSKDINGKIKKNSTLKNKGSNIPEEKIQLNNNIKSNLEKTEMDKKIINIQKGGANTQVIESSIINSESNFKEKDKELLSIFKSYKNKFVNINDNKLNKGFQVKNSIDNMNKENNKNKNINKNKEECLRNFIHKIKLSGIINILFSQKI